MLGIFDAWDAKQGIIRIDVPIQHRGAEYGGKINICFDLDRQN